MVWASKTGLDESPKGWERRIRRARELQDDHPAAADPLRFYELVLGFQRELASDFSKPAIRSDVPLREQIDVELVSSRFPDILALAAESGPEALRRRARAVQHESEASWRSMLQAGLEIARPNPSVLDGFFALACLQPIAESLQSLMPVNPNYSQSLCPACGGLPLLSVLRPEGEGASRWLACSFCLREWLFRRIVCSWCGEEDKEKLPRYSAEECGHVLVEACDTCKRYLKAVDMSIDGRAEPLVDEAALAVLDVWAVDHGYTKIAQNLIGF